MVSGAADKLRDEHVASSGLIDSALSAGGDAIQADEAIISYGLEGSTSRVAFVEHDLDHGLQHKALFHLGTQRVGPPPRGLLWVGGLGTSKQVTGAILLWVDTCPARRPREALPCRGEELLASICGQPPGSKQDVLSGEEEGVVVQGDGRDMRAADGIALVAEACGVASERALGSEASVKNVHFPQVFAIAMRKT